jgi:hypothetical protein
MAQRVDIIHFLLKPDKGRIIAEYDLCYHINNQVLSVQAGMDGKLMLTEEEIPVSYIYDCLDMEESMNQGYVSAIWTERGSDWAPTAVRTGGAINCST